MPAIHCCCRRRGCFGGAFAVAAVSAGKRSRRTGSAGKETWNRVVDKRQLRSAKGGSVCPAGCRAGQHTALAQQLPPSKPLSHYRPQRTCLRDGAAPGDPLARLHPLAV